MTEPKSYVLMTSLTSFIEFGAFPREMLAVLYNIRWAVVTIAFLIMADFVLGLIESVRIRKESWRKSRAIRRTYIKFFEYLFLCILGGTLVGLVFTGNVEEYNAGTIIGTFIPIYCESDSIYGHVCAIHGRKRAFSIKRLILGLLKARHADLGQAVSDAVIEDADNDNNQKK